MPRFGRFTRGKAYPIGVHLDGQHVTLAQLTGSGDRVSVLACAAGTVPDDQCDAAALDECLQRLLADHHFSGRSVVSALPSEDLQVQNVRMPQTPASELAQMLQWEARERLNIPYDEAEVRHLPGGVIRQDGIARQEVILLAARRDAVRKHIAFLESAGLQPTAIDLPACALLRGQLLLSATTVSRNLGSGDSVPTTDQPSESQSGRRAYLHFGQSAVTVLVAAGDNILFLKSLPGGGAQLNAQLAREIGVSVTEAATMRRAVVRARKLNADDDLHRAVIDALRTRLESLAGEIEMCLRHVKVTFRTCAADDVQINGPDAADWLAEFLAERLQLPVSCTFPERLESAPPAFRDDPGRFAIAAGLSLRGCRLPLAKSA